VEYSTRTQSRVFDWLNNKKAKMNEKKKPTKQTNKQNETDKKKTNDLKLYGIFCCKGKFCKYQSFLHTLAPELQRFTAG